MVRRLLRHADPMGCLLLTLVFGAATSAPDPLTSGRGFVQEPARTLKFGLSGGFGSGPRWPFSPGWWSTGELALFLELPLNRVSLRFGAAFRPGATESRVLLGVHAEFEARFHPVPRFSFGGGVDGGFLNVGSAPVESTIMFIAPKLTLAALRLGPSLQHELSLSATMLVWPFITIAGGFGFLRYAFLF